MASTWQNLIDWSEPRSIASLTSGYGARKVIPNDRGFYAFVTGKRPPSPGNCLYLGIAVSKAGLYGRLASYLRTDISQPHAERMKHRGKRLLAFARMKGIEGTGKARTNTAKNDRSIFVSWAVAPLHFAGKSVNEREYAFMLERALIDFFRPIYNTADWELELDFELDDEAY